MFINAMALGSVRLFLRLQSRKQFSFLPLSQESKRTVEMLLKANGPLIEGILKGGEDRRGTEEESGVGGRDAIIISNYSCPYERSLALSRPSE